MNNKLLMGEWKGIRGNSQLVMISGTGGWALGVSSSNSVEAQGPEVLSRGLGTILILIPIRSLSNAEAMRWAKSKRAVPKPRDFETEPTFIPIPIPILIPILSRSPEASGHRDEPLSKGIPQSSFPLCRFFIAFNF